MSAVTAAVLPWDRPIQLGRRSSLFSVHVVFPDPVNELGFEEHRLHLRFGVKHPAPSLLGRGRHSDRLTTLGHGLVNLGEKVLAPIHRHRLMCRSSSDNSSSGHSLPDIMNSPKCTRFCSISKAEESSPVPRLGSCRGICAP